MSHPVIVAGTRSAIGTAGRSLAGIRADQLAGPVLAATLERSGLAPTDVTDVVLGRLAAQTAALLRGKHKPTFAPHMDMGDYVIIINAEKVALTGAKLAQKRAYRHSGFPGGLRSENYAEMLEKHPTRAVEKAVRGMLPKNRLGRQQITKLKVYAGAEHPHAAQQPKPFEITQVAQ